MGGHPRRQFPGYKVLGGVTRSQLGRTGADSRFVLPILTLFFLVSELIRLTAEGWFARHILYDPLFSAPEPPVIIVLPLVVVNAALIGWLCAFRIAWFKAAAVAIGLTVLRLALFWFGPDWMNAALN